METRPESITPDPQPVDAAPATLDPQPAAASADAPDPQPPTPEAEAPQAPPVTAAEAAASPLPSGLTQPGAYPPATAYAPGPTQAPAGHAPYPGGQPQAPYVPAVYAPASQDTQRMMFYDANKKSVGVAYALWFFLGFVGGHRFYLNRASSAAAMLCITIVSWFLTVILIGFAGLLAVGIWMLVDAFTIPDWVREHNNRLIAGLSQ